MPVMSGWDVLDALQALQPHLLRRCAVYILTSSLAPADMDRARAQPLVAGLLRKLLNRVKIHAIQAPTQGAA